MAPATIDEYLADVPVDKRASLERLRRQIQAAAPDAVEVISYGLPTFKFGGRWLVAFGAWKRHCSFYVGGSLHGHVDELGGYRLQKGTINFPADRPLPEELVTRLVRERVMQAHH